jgi:hypothetical protein
MRVRQSCKQPGQLQTATPGTILLVGPTPLYAWSLVWRSRWLEYDPSRDWLPELYRYRGD